MPGLEVLIPGIESAGPSRLRTARLEAKHPVWVALLCVVCFLVLALGVLMLVISEAGAVGRYGDATRLAHAPACSAGTDLATSHADCVGTMTLAYGSAVRVAGYGESALDLTPSGGGPDSVFSPSFPPSAAFTQAVGSGSGTVRAEFWQGRIVALTAGSGAGVTVATDLNPDDEGGVDVSDSLIGLSFILLALLMLALSRSVRRRWLRPGPVTRITLISLTTCMLGSLFTGSALFGQPSRVLLASVLGPVITASTTGVLCLGPLISQVRSRRLNAALEYIRPQI